MTDKINFSNVAINSIEFDSKDNSFKMEIETLMCFNDNEKSFFDLRNKMRNPYLRSNLCDMILKMPDDFKPAILVNPSWIDSKNEKISYITKVITDGPATIIIDKSGRKTVVKLQDDNNYYSKLLGFYMCLLRYILDKKRYHEVVEDIFDNRFDHNKLYAARTILVALLGKKEVENLVYRFYGFDESQ